LKRACWVALPLLIQSRWDAPLKVVSARVRLVGSDW